MLQCLVVSFKSKIPLIVRHGAMSDKKLCLLMQHCGKSRVAKTLLEVSTGKHEALAVRLKHENHLRCISDVAERAKFLNTFPSFNDDRNPGDSLSIFQHQHWTSFNFNESRKVFHCFTSPSTRKIFVFSSPSRRKISLSAETNRIKSSGKPETDQKNLIWSV